MLGFVFNTTPHNSSHGKEGLEAVLAASAYSENICLFFMDDACLQLLDDQDAMQVLTKNYSPMHKLLALYDIDQVYVHQSAMARYGLVQDDLTISVTPLTDQQMTEKLTQCQTLISF